MEPLALLALVLEAYISGMKAHLFMLEHQTSEQQAVTIEIMVKRDAWWQEHLFDKLGNLIDKIGDLLDHQQPQAKHKG
jgi:hypothetical protein